MLESSKSAVSSLGPNMEEIIPGVLFSMGGMLPASRCRAWIPEETDGFIPFQCYAFVDGEKVFLVDACLPVLRAEVFAGLRKILTGSKKRYFMMTRRELDTILNLPEIVREFDFASVHCGGEMNPLDFFDKLDNSNAEEHGRMLSEVPFFFQTEGPIASPGRIRLEMFKSPIMVLPTYWFYEENSRTLLSSDFWGFLGSKDNDRHNLVCSDPAEISADAIASYLNVKFDWLASIDTSPLARDLKAIFAKRPVTRICPTHGRMFEGDVVIEKLLEETLSALAAMARQPQKNLLEGWVYRGRTASGNLPDDHL